MRSIGWGAGGSGLAGYCEPQDQALHGIAPRTAPSPRSGTPLPRRGGSCRRRPAENRARTWPHPCISRAAGRSAPALPENPLTFPPDWDTIVEQNRPDGASTVHTAGTERAPRLKAPTARRTGDGPTSGPGDGRGPLPAPEGPEGAAALRTWVAPRRQALSSRDKGRERLFAGKRPQKGACRGDYQSPAVSFPIPRAHTQVRPYGKPDPPGIPFPIFRRRGVQRPPPTAPFVGAGVPDGPPSAQGPARPGGRALR